MEYDIEKYQNGATFYYKKGTKIIHREDGPAIHWLYSKIWYANGKKHRSDGPAVEYPNGSVQWWINGERLSPAKETILNKWWNNKNSRKTT